MRDYPEEMRQWREIPLAGDGKVQNAIRLDIVFPDPEGLLETAYAFVRRLKSRPMLLAIRQETTSAFEEYSIETAPGKAIISAADTEGIRRGIYHLADLLRCRTPEELPAEKRRWTPQISLRMSRYRFGSLKHPSTLDEFSEEADYFPEPFLERMAMERVNVLWFTADTLKSACLNDWMPENQERKMQMYRKIQQNAERCRKYGIRLFAYMVIPTPWEENAPVLQRHPNLAGPRLAGASLFCPAFDGQRYIYDCVRQFFSAVPALGGLIAIVYGEGSYVCTDIASLGSQLCMDKCRLSKGQIYAKLMTAIYNGMHDASPTADLVAWFYMPASKCLPDFLEEAVRLSPSKIIYQCNAESGVAPMQLGKPRKVDDYWQCITELAPMYKEFAAMMSRNGRRLSAKIQVGTSHEMGSVPYVPVPALLYRKYRNLLQEGTVAVQQCWKNGGTPGMMNLAAGMLSFLDFETATEQDFLHTLADTLWPGHQDEAVRGWQILSEAFTNYPYSTIMQYFGPVADGVNWPMNWYLEEKPLQPTWRLNKVEDYGDNYFECLNNHSLDELVQLFGELYSQWQAGLEIFRGIQAKTTLNTQQQLEITLLEALAVHFGTSWRIFHFYQLRQNWLDGEHSVLEKLKSIVRQELQERRKMLDLIDQLPVLGYNPEPHGYKYTKDSIRASFPGLAKTLQDLEHAALDTPPVTPVHAIAILDGRTYTTQKFAWKGIVENGSIIMDFQCFGKQKVLDEFFYAFDDCGRHFPLMGYCDGDGHNINLPKGTTCKIQVNHSGWSIHLEQPIALLPGASLKLCRFNAVRLLNDYDHRCSWPGTAPAFKPCRLAFAFYDAADMGLLLEPSSDNVTK